MKKVRPFIAFLLIVCTLSSCATVFGGHVDSYQRTRPTTGQPTRAIRPVAMIADIVLFWPGLIVDFATCAIYKPAPTDAAPASTATSTKTAGANN